MIDLKTLTKMETALLAEAQRQLYCWWPYDEQPFWLLRMALLAVLGERADADALHVSPSGRAMLASRLAHFNESADLAKSAIIPYGWQLVPCPPTEKMLQACLATWPGPRAETKSVIERLKAWFAKRRHQGCEEPSTERDDRLQWLDEHRAAFTTNYLAMVDEAPPPPWARS